MIGNLKRCTLVCTIVAAFSMAGALDSSSQRYAVLSAVSSQVFVVCEAAGEGNDRGGISAPAYGGYITPAAKRYFREAQLGSQPLLARSVARVSQNYADQPPKKSVWTAAVFP